MIEIQVLSTDDWPLWRELRLAALADAPYAFGSTLADWQGDGDREERWRARLNRPESYNLVARVDGRPVGMASGIPTEQPDGVELISMWVSLTARGKRVGDRLIHEVERWAVERGADALILAVTHGNAAATGLYRRNGFTDSGELGDLMSDGVHREHIMTKSLHS